MPMLSLPIEEDTRDSGGVRATPAAVETALEPIRAAIRGIRFGEVRVVIQDGVVIQIDRLEKQRLK
jgi:hypothetical protein